MATTAASPLVVHRAPATARDPTAAIATPSGGKLGALTLAGGPPAHQRQEEQHLSGRAAHGLAEWVAATDVLAFVAQHRGELVG